MLVLHFEFLVMHLKSIVDSFVEGLVGKLLCAFEFLLKRADDVGECLDLLLELLNNSRGV